MKTTRFGPAPFSFSYSKLKNFETCPKRHYEIDIRKSVKEEESDQLRDGNETHKALAKAAQGTPLPKPYAGYQKWIDRVLTGPGIIHVEQKYAITKDFGPTEFFAKDAWYRGIADLVKLNGPVALAIDYKTGKIVEDAVQLGLMAACVFAHFPQVQAIRTEYIWLREDATTQEIWKRDQMPTFWNNIWERIENLEAAFRTTTYPAKPGGLCAKWCLVKTCPHNGAY